MTMVARTDGPPNVGKQSGTHTRSRNSVYPVDALQMVRRRTWEPRAFPEPCTIAATIANLSSSGEVC